MSNIPPSPLEQPEFEGDYRPADSAHPSAHLDPINARVEPADVAYLMQLAEALNTTLDLQTLLSRTAELVGAVIHYRIFAIFLLNDRTNELRMRFQIGHTPEVERMRIPLGKGVAGQVAQTRQPVLLNDVSTAENYINANPGVRSELAVPLVVKNRLIGVIDLESEQAGYFRPEHLHLLTITASRIAQAIENARLYPRVPLQAAPLGGDNAMAGDLAFIAYHTNFQPRYYLIAAMPMAIVLVEGLHALLGQWRQAGADPARAAERRRSLWLLNLFGATVLVGLIWTGAETVIFAFTPQYSFLTAAQSIAAVVRADKGVKPLLLSDTGDDITLFTDLPGLCDAYSLDPHPVLMQRYQPGWFAAWPSKIGNEMQYIERLRGAYRLDEVARYRVFDDPTRDQLVLYRLTPR
jgi:putative methionine-R-sulfoxide reductase with GAF domain